MRSNPKMPIPARDLWVRLPMNRAAPGRLGFILGLGPGFSLAGRTSSWATLVFSLKENGKGDHNIEGVRLRMPLALWPAIPRITAPS
jgi:hypothetical protein